MNFSPDRLRVNRFLVRYACHAKISNFLETFGSSVVRLGSIPVSGPLLGEPISDVGSGIGQLFGSGFVSLDQFYHVYLPFSQNIQHSTIKCVLGLVL